MVQMRKVKKEGNRKSGEEEGRDKRRIGKRTYREKKREQLKYRCNEKEKVN